MTDATKTLACGHETLLQCVNGMLNDLTSVGYDYTAYGHDKHFPCAISSAVDISFDELRFAASAAQTNGESAVAALNDRLQNIQETRRRRIDELRRNPILIHSASETTSADSSPSTALPSGPQNTIGNENAVAAQHSPNQESDEAAFQAQTFRFGRIPITAPR